MPEKPANEEKKKEEQKKNLWQMIKFTLFSISAGIIQILSYTLFYEALHWAPWLSYLVSLVLSVLWNFTFNRKYTFRSDADIRKSMLLVALFYVVFTPLSTWWTAALTGENPFTGAQASSEPLVNNYVVQIGTMLINFVTEFLYQKFVVYRGSIDTNEQARKERKDPE
jgi:putative flippase GtrA